MGEDSKSFIIARRLINDACLYDRARKIDEEAKAHNKVGQITIAVRDDSGAHFDDVRADDYAQKMEKNIKNQMLGLSEETLIGVMLEIDEIAKTASEDIEKNTNPSKRSLEDKSACETIRNFAESIKEIEMNE